MTIRGLATGTLLLAAIAAGAAVGASGAPRSAREAVTLRNGLALIDARTGAVKRTWDASYGTAAGIVSDGGTGWFVTSFQPGFGLVHLRSNGDQDSGWRAELPPGTQTEKLVRVGSRLYVTLHDFNPARFRVASLDAVTGRRLWITPSFRSAHAQGAPDTITALAANRSRVFVGGIFGGVGRVRQHVLVALSTDTGRPLRWRVPVGVVPADVVTVVALGPPGRLYAGFSGRVAAFNERTGALLPWDAAYSGWDTTAITIIDHTVVVGGTFGFGGYDETTGREPAWIKRGLKQRLSGNVFARAGDTLYVGGNLRSGTVGNNLGAFNARTGEREPWKPKLARYVSVGTIAPSGTNLLVSGSFTSSIG
ncbi:MAG: C-terminal target protein [Actinomycetia bacterium]|jgi:outer membrane protein assembly factor BamB|nr:C-terminal target protein [Actinomycetes bacterium]